MYDKSNRLVIAKSGDKEIVIYSKMLNRHGLITGATGTGKTVSLQTLTETFSSAGIPVFAADVKGDFSGVSNIGGGNAKVDERIDELKLKDLGFQFTNFPVCFWDVFGEKGHPIRTTISELGPVMISRLLGLNDTQTGVLSLIFKIADENNLLLLDLKDLQKTLEFVGNNRADFITTYGNISTASIGAIQRGLIQLEQEGAEYFLGEPALNIFDLIQTKDGKGVVNVLAADRLINSPRVYTTFLLWLMSELFEQLPEVGDLDKPKIVFFFDEAHLLFKDSPKALTDKIEQTVRLIRSKGVGIYFVTQTPSDIPASILGQLGNRVQHALRAFTPNDQKAVNAAANTFRINPEINTKVAITELEVGEALVSFLDEKGMPQMVERAYILPPEGQIGPISDSEREQAIKQSLFYGRYENMVDRESAFEILQAKVIQDSELKEQEKAAKKATSGKKEKTFIDDFVGQLGKTATRQFSNEIVKMGRGILGSLLRGK